MDGRGLPDEELALRLWFLVDGDLGFYAIPSALEDLLLREASLKQPAIPAGRSSMRSRRCLRSARACRCILAIVVLCGKCTSGRAHRLPAAARSSDGSEVGAAAPV